MPPITRESFMSFRFQKHFPVELVEEFLCYAWNDLVDHDSKQHDNVNSISIRWELFKNVSGTCKQWRAVLYRLCMRDIMIGNPDDLSRYKCLHARCSGQGKGGSGQKSLNLDRVRNRSLHLSVFEGYSRQNWEHFFEDLLPLVQHCPTARLSIKDIEDGHASLLFDFLRRLAQLTSLYLIWNRYKLKVYLPNTELPSVTYLRINQFPNYMPCHISVPEHGERLFARHLLARFTSMHTLHIDTPIFLKKLIPPSPSPSPPPPPALAPDIPLAPVLAADITSPEIPFPPMLATVILEAPALTPNPYATIQAWNITAALNGGFLPGTHARRIVINTADGEVSGWAEAAAACAAHGVRLERGHTSIRLPPARPPPAFHPSTGTPMEQMVQFPEFPPAYYAFNDHFRASPLHTVGEHINISQESALTGALGP